MRGQVKIVTIALFVVVSIGFIAILKNQLNQTRDTIENRKRVTGELRVFRDRLRDNPTDREALTNLIWALDDPYRFKRVKAAGFLGGVGTAAKDAVPALAKALKKNENFFSDEAARALANLGTDARAAIPELIEASHSGKGTLAWNAVKALSNMQSDAVTVVPALIKCLDGVGDPLPDGGTVGPQLAIEASNALAKFGTQAREALTPLKSKLNNTPSVELRLSLARAIRFIDPEDAESLEVLITLVNDGEIYSFALTTLGEFGTNANAAIPAVETYLEQQMDDGNRRHAEFTLQKLKHNPPMAVEQP